MYPVILGTDLASVLGCTRQALQSMSGRMGHTGKKQRRNNKKGGGEGVHCVEILSIMV